MEKESKTKVLVLYGGKSTEYEISLRSAKFIISAIDKDNFDVIPILLDKNGRWLLENNNSLIEVRPFLREKTLVSVSTFSPIAHFDIVFPIVHGTCGEDGALPGLFEVADLPYVGPDILSAAVAMDKIVAKKLVEAADIPIVPYVGLYLAQWNNNKDYYFDYIDEYLHYPIFVKPANVGSSVGIFKVEKREDLENAVQQSFRYDLKILIEKAIDAREIEVAVLGNCSSSSEIIASVPGEIIPSHEFYSYEAKYLDENGAELVVPAKLTEEQIGQIRNVAKSVFEILECVGMARIDFFLDKNSGKFLFNEANTVPGFTKISMYPRLFAATGISNSELITRLIELGMERYTLKKNLIRDIKNS